MVRSNPVALKEWAIVVHALREGQQLLLLRKGGIADAGGPFHLAKSEFSLYPTFLHQDQRYVRPDFHTAFERILQEGPGHGRVRIDSYAVVEAVFRAPDPGALQELAPYHIWAPAYVALRYQYRPEHPLYVLLLRTYRLRQPLEFAETPAYRGCKSWVTLDIAIDTAGAVPVLADGEFRERAQAVRDTLRL